MYGPDNFQYGGSVTPAAAPADGLIRLARGWFDSAGNLVRAATEPTRATSPTSIQYSAQNARQVNTVETDGGSGLFADLRAAASQTLLGALSNAINRDEPQITQVRQPMVAAPATIAGFPAAGVIAVGVVATVIYWKYG